MGLPASTRARRILAAAVLCCAFTGLTVSASQASPTAKQSIIGGEAGSIADLPSLAFIEAADPRDGIFSCTGTVIAPRVILTAAHCAENLEGGGFTPASDYLVVTGVDDLRQVNHRDALRVESTHVFPEFDPGNLHGDAAILVLASPTAATPIPLATSADAALYEGGATVRLAGWGLTNGRQPNSAPKQLQTTTTVVQDPATCKRRTRRFNSDYSPAFQLCTQNPPDYKSGGCHGDSGGPVIAQRADGSAVEIGVVSTGGPLCSTKLPNVFTRVDRLATWATEWVAAIETGGPPPSVPQARVPAMSRENGEGYAIAVLIGSLSRYFHSAEHTKGNCARHGRSAVKCALAWDSGPNIYAVTISVFYAVRRNAIVWDDHYRIQWVNRHCWLTSAHRQRCAVHSQHR